MIRGLHLSTLVWGAVIILFVMLVLDGVQVTTGLFKPCGGVVTVLTLLLLAFDKWLWCFRILHPWFVDRPYLKGTWKGVFVSSYIDPATQKPVPPIEAYLVIRQTYSVIHLRLITKESASESLANNIPKGEDGVYSVASVYRNTPQLVVRDRSPIHHGALLIRVEGDPAVSLTGEYWTDRMTRGELRFMEKSETMYFDFAAASAGTFTKLEATPAAPAPASSPVQSPAPVSGPQGERAREIEQHVINVDLDTPICRIFPLKWMIPSLTNRQLVLRKPAGWDDPFENFLFKVSATYGTQPIALDQLRERIYAQCWMMCHESDAMWRIYSKTPPMRSNDKYNEWVGVKVRTTVRKLFSALYSSGSNPELCFWAGRVTYLTEAEMDQIGLDNDTLIGLMTDTSAKGHAQSLLLKREPFSHEAEVRFVFDANNGFDITQENYSFNVDPNTTYDEIILDPRLSENNCRLLFAELREAGYRGAINQSALYFPRPYVVQF